MCIGKTNDLRDIPIGQRDRRAYDETVFCLGHAVNSDVGTTKARAGFVSTGLFSEFDAVIILQTYRAPLEKRVGATGHEAYLYDGANGLTYACQFLSSSTGQLRD